MPLLSFILLAGEVKSKDNTLIMGMWEAKQIVYNNRMHNTIYT